MSSAQGVSPSFIVVLKHWLEKKGYSFRVSILAESAALTRNLQGVIVHLPGMRESAERFGGHM